MAHDAVTMATKTIHNPAEPRHYMRFKPIANHVRVRAGGQVLAESSQAMRMTEVARDLYDSVTYFPLADISSELKLIPDKTTHCPLKGDAQYFTLNGEQAIAWTYATVFDFAKELKGYVAFYGDQVVQEETGVNA